MQLRLNVEQTRTNKKGNKFFSVNYNGFGQVSNVNIEKVIKERKRRYVD